MKLIIHAGIHRTGTSSLQRFLHQNREALAEASISYPGTEIHHQKAAWALKRNPSEAGCLDELLRPCATSRLCIMSGEDFCIHTDLSWLETLAARHEVHAVLYLRRQDHWMMSWYNQHIKWPFDASKSRMGKEEFLACVDEFHWLDFHSLLQRWSECIGRDRLSIAVVEPGQVEDVVSDFVARAGLPAAKLAPIEKRDNDSLPVHLLEVARQLGLHEMPAKARIRVIGALRRGLADKASAARTVFSHEERKTILAKFEQSNRRAANDFLGLGELFLENPPSAQDPCFSFPELSTEEFVRQWIKPFLQALAKA